VHGAFSKTMLNKAGVEAVSASPAAMDEREIVSDRGSRQQAVWQFLFVVLLVSAAFVLRLWGMSKTHFWDEAAYLQNAEVICCGKTNYSELASRPPLLSLIYAAVFLVWHHVYAACIVTALLNALGPALLYFSGRLIAGRAPAAIAALMLAFCPFFVGVFPAGFVSDDTGNSLLSDSPALTLILLAFWLLLRALRQPAGLRFAAAGFVLALTVLMRFPSLSSVGVLGLLVFAAAQWWKAAFACGAGFAAGITPYLCWSRFRYGDFLATFYDGWGQFDGPRESPLFYVKNFANIFSWITLAGLALWIIRRVWENWRERGSDRPAAVESAAETRSPRLEIFLWLWAAVLLLFFSALNHQEPRYIIPLAPPLFLLAGIGLGWVFEIRQKAARAAGIVVLAGAFLYTLLPLRERFESPFLDDEVSQIMEVSDFLNQNVPPTTVLYANFNYPVFGYYTNLPVHPVTARGPDLYDALNRLPGDGILIAYRESSDIADPSLSWLDANPHFRRFREFSSLVLYEYRVNAGK
jgi:4-amino-4-deoxy-L-arabinose transferase-like glycosyltransferase